MKNEDLNLVLMGAKISPDRVMKLIKIEFNRRQSVAVFIIVARLSLVNCVRCEMFLMNFPELLLFNIAKHQQQQ